MLNCDKFKFGQNPLLLQSQLQYNHKTMKSPYYRVGLLLRNFGSFCTNSKHQKYQMALAAAGAIRYILSLPMEQNNMWNQLNFYNQKLRQDSKESPLSDNIIKHLQSNPQISPETVNKFKEMFDPSKGVALPNHLLTQSRIRDGRNSNGRFSFFPNRIVTIPIFNIINHIDKKTLVHGNAGISKTVSFIYYSYLAQLITQYELEFNESIAKDIPRLLYFTYQKRQQQSELLQHLSKMIRSHFPQKFITENNLQTQFNPILLYLSLEKAIKTPIQFKVIVDQFNSFSAECRQFNTAVDKNTFTNAKKQWLTFEKQKWFYSAAYFTQNRVIFNSSQNFEQSVVGRAQEPRISFNINHHSRANNFNIDFFNINSSIDTHRQIVYLLFFELLRMSQSEIMKKAKPTFLKVANSQIFEEESFITPYQMRMFLEQNKNQILKEIEQKNFNGESKLMEWITDIITTIGERNIDEAKASTKKFSNEGTQQIKAQKLVFIMDVRRILQKRSEVIEKNKMPKNLPWLFDLQNSDSDWFRFPLKKEIVDKNLFEVTNNRIDDTVTQLRLKFSFNDFMDITASQKEKFISILTKTDSQAYQLTSEYYSNASKGQFFDSIVVKILSSYRTSLTYYDYKKEQEITFTLQRAINFQHFNQTKDILDFNDRFKQFRERKKQFVCGVPVTKGNQSKSPNSASFDFIIINYLKDGSFIVNSWDLTIQKSNATKKLKTSFKKIQNILDNQYKDKTQPYDENAEKAEKTGEVKKTLKTGDKESMLIIKQWNHYVMAYPQIYSEKTAIYKYENEEAQISIKVNCCNSNIQKFVVKPENDQGDISLENRMKMVREQNLLKSSLEQILSAINTQ